MSGIAGSARKRVLDIVRGGEWYVRWIHGIGLGARGFGSCRAHCESLEP